MKARLMEIYEEMQQEALDENVSPTFLAAQRIYELEKDEARLDWIEKSGGRCGQYENGFFAHPLAQGDKYEVGETLREAIDNAMALFR